MRFTHRWLYLLLFFALSGCVPFRSVFLAGPDVRDMKRFKSAPIAASDSCFGFQKVPNISLKVTDWTTNLPVFSSIDEVVQTHRVNSFIVLQNDTVKYEYYGPKYGQESLHTSYSIAKSFTSALIGIAIQEGHIKSEKDLVATYVPEMAGLPYANQLTIEHLLNQTSGIKYSIVVDAFIYYGRNSLKALPRIKFEAPPGTLQRYLNINIELLGLILKRATGIAPAEYLAQKIWQPLHMCNSAQWSIDEKNGQEKTFCCMGATALDYARFGRLFAHKGVWEGKRIISEDWYSKSTARDTTGGSSFNHQYCWHLGLKQYGDFMAIGFNKQHIYINPAKNLVIVLLADREKQIKAERVNWWFVFRQIADEL